MRRIISSGSVKAIWLEREEVLSKLKDAARKAKEVFPEIEDIRIFGSFAKKEETGLSDLDILIIANWMDPDPIARIRPYFYFFSNSLQIALDVLVLNREEAENMKNFVDKSFSLLLEEPS